MATIDVGVNLNLIDSSLRDIAADIRRTVQGLSPQLDVKINDAAIRRFLTTGGAGGLPTIQVDAKLSDDSKRSLSAALKRVATNIQITRLGFDPGALSRLQKQFTKALNDAAKAQEAVRVSSAEFKAAGGATATGEKETAAQRVAQLDLNKKIGELAGVEDKIVAIVEDILGQQTLRRKFNDDLRALSVQQTNQAQNELATGARISRERQKRAVTEKLLASRIKAQLDAAALPSQADIGGPTIDFDRAQAKAGQDAVIEGRLIVAKLKLETAARDRSAKAAEKKAAFDEAQGRQGPTIEAPRAAIDAGEDAAIQSRLIVAKLELEAAARERSVRAAEAKAVFDDRQKQAAQQLESEAKASEALAKEKNDALKRDLAAVEASNKFTQEVAGLNSKLSSILRERVAQAQKEGLLPGGEDDLGAEIRGGAQILAESLRRGGRVIRGSTEQIAAQLETRRIKDSLDGAREGFNAAERESKKLAGAIARQAAIVIIAEGSGNQRAIEATESKLLTLQNRRAKSQEEANRIATNILVLENQLRNAKAEELRNLKARSRTFKGARGGGGGGGDTVTFRGAQDIESFGNKLNPQQLERFVKALRGTAAGAGNASQQVRKFGNSIKSSNTFVQSVEASITTGTRAAFEFGKQINFAAQRLAAWATPAAFLFRAITLIQQAADEIIRLDTQAARLEFFRPNGSIINQFIEGGATLSDVLNKNAQDISLFIGEAKKLGADVNDVASAFLIAARVGEDFVQVERDLAGTSSQVSSELSRIVIGLVRLEAGALSAEDAVRKIVAVSRQFLEQLGRLDQSFREQQFTNIGAQLAVVAGETTFNVSELSDAVTRVGAAFSQVQGTSIPVVLKTIATAAKATGSSASRLGTTFRQLLTLAQQNEVALQSFGISIRNAGSGQVEFSGILDALQKIQDLSTTAPEAAARLTKLLFDRRNVSDGRAIANIVSQLRDEFRALEGQEAQAASVGDAVVKQFVQQETQALSLESRLNSLNASFTEFVATLGASEGIRGLVDFAQAAVEGLNSLSQEIETLEPLVLGLGTVFATKLVPQIFAALKGALTGLVVSIFGTGLRQQIAGLLGNTETLVVGINRAEKEGLLTQKQAALARKESLRVIQGSAIAQEQLDAAVAKEAAFQKSALATVKQKELATLELQVATERNNQAIARESVLQRKNIAALSQKSRFLTNNLLPTLAFVGVAAGALLGDSIAKGLSNEKGVQSAITSSINFATTGAFIGAQIGSAIAPGIGTAIGAGIGLIGGGTFGAITTLNEEQAKSDKEKKIRQEAEIKRTAAVENELVRINKQRDLELRRISSKSDFEKDILRRTFELRGLQVELNGLDQDSAQAKALQTKILREQAGIQKITELSLENQVKIEARKVSTANKILDIRQQEQIAIAQLELAQQSLIGTLTKAQTAEISIVFSQSKIEEQLASLRQQIEQEIIESESPDVLRDTKAAEASQRKISQLRQQATLLQIRLENESIKKREAVLQAATRETKTQVSAWEKAAKIVTKSFKDVIGLQKGLGDILINQGEAAADAIGRRADLTREVLEISGLSIESRLSSVRQETARQLSELERAGGLADASLASGGIAAFRNADQINSAVDDLVITIQQAAERAGDKEFTDAGKSFDLQLSLLREEERVKRQLFALEINQTRNEIGLRRNLISKEIELFRVRQKAELDLLKERAEQQKRFGQVVLDGPEKIKEVTESLAAAEGFFKNIADLDSEGLRTIFQRARGALARGQTDALKQVVQGLENRISLGGPDIVATIDNEKLKDVLLRALDPRITARTLERQLKKEEDVARGQLAASQEIEARQQELFELNKRDESLQRAQIRIAEVDGRLATRQRDRQLVIAGQSLAAQLAQIGILDALRQRGRETAAADIQGGRIQQGVGAASELRNAVVEGINAASQPTVDDPDKISDSRKESSASSRNKQLADILSKLGPGFKGDVDRILADASNNSARLGGNFIGVGANLNAAIAKLPNAIAVLLSRNIPGATQVAPDVRETSRERESRARQQSDAKRDAALGEIKVINDELLKQQISDARATTPDGILLERAIVDLKRDSQKRLNAIENADTLNTTFDSGLSSLLEAFREQGGRRLTRSDISGPESAGARQSLLQEFGSFLTTVTQANRETAQEEQRARDKDSARREQRDTLLRAAIERFNTQANAQRARTGTPGLNVFNLDDLSERLNTAQLRLSAAQDRGITGTGTNFGREIRELKQQVATIETEISLQEKANRLRPGVAGATPREINEALKELRSALKAEFTFIQQRFRDLPEVNTQIRGVATGFELLRKKAEELGVKLDDAGAAAVPGTPGAPGVRGDSLVGIARVGSDLRNALNDAQQRVSFRNQGRGFRLQGADTRRLAEELALQRERGAPVTGRQQRELDRLERRDTIGNRGLTGARSLSRALLQDVNFSEELEKGFQDLFKGNVVVTRGTGADAQRINTGRTFAEELREVTGARRRSGETRLRGRDAASLSVDATKQLLGDVGLGALADQIQTREQAVEIVNQLFKLNENLGKDTKAANKRVEEILQKILEAEVKRGRDQTADTSTGAGLEGGLFEEGSPAARQRGIRAREDAAEREQTQKLLQESRGVINEQVKKVSEATQSAVTSIAGVFEEGANRLEQVRINTKNDVNFSIKFDTSGAPTAQQFAQFFAAELDRSGIALSQDTIDIIIKSIKQNSGELSRRGLLAGIPIIEGVEEE